MQINSETIFHFHQKLILRREREIIKSLPYEIRVSLAAEFYKLLKC
jgi:hypothetical protein